MESKIEKLKLKNHDLIVDYDRIEGKINQIIDYLNSQDQEDRYAERVRIKGELSGETEHIKAHKEYLETSKQETQEEWEKEWEITPVYNQVSFIKSLLGRAKRGGYIDCLEELIKNCKNFHKSEDMVRFGKALEIRLEIELSKLKDNK